MTVVNVMAGTDLGTGTMTWREQQTWHDRPAEVLL